jgi:hypothetical protein
MLPVDEPLRAVEGNGLSCVGRLVGPQVTRGLGGANEAPRGGQRGRNAVARDEPAGSCTVAPRGGGALLE